MLQHLVISGLSSGINQEVGAHVFWVDFKPLLC